MDFRVLGIYNKWWQNVNSIDTLEKELLGQYEKANCDMLPPLIEVGEFLLKKG